MHLSPSYNPSPLPLLLLVLQEPDPWLQNIANPYDNCFRRIQIRTVCTSKYSNGFDTSNTTTTAAGSKSVQYTPTTSAMFQNATTERSVPCTVSRVVLL